MPFDFLSRWFKRQPPQLFLQVAGGVLRFMVREDARAVRWGTVNLPTAGGMFDVATVRVDALAQWGDMVADVGVLLPAVAVHTHHLNLPVGLDDDELEYQVTRHITHDLGLSLSDVYYDWSPEPDSNSNQHEQSVLLAVARQAEVAQYAQLLAGTGLNLRWVCAEPLVWGRAYARDGRHAVCQVESSSIQLFGFDGLGRIKTVSKQFNAEQMSRVGFEYISTDHAAHMQLPLRFVVDELENALGQIDKAQLQVIYVMGTGVSWSTAIPQLQSHFGLPVRMADSGIEAHSAYAGLWMLSEQIKQERA